MEIVVESEYARVVAALGEPLVVVSLPRGQLLIYAERIVPIGAPATMEFASLGFSSCERAERSRAGGRMTDEQIARVCHEANRGLQAADPAPGIPVASRWEDFGDERAGVVEGVRLARAGATPRELHESWCAAKRAGGWVFGVVKDSEARTHPCLVAYEDLPAEQRVKDALFSAIVGALAG